MLLGARLCCLLLPLLQRAGPGRRRGLRRAGTTSARAPKPSGAVPGCAALAPHVSLLQGVGTPSTGTLRTKVRPWCHRPGAALAPAATASPWPWALLLAEAASAPPGDGTGPCPRMVPRVLPAPTAPSVLPGDYLYLDENRPPEVLGGPARCEDTYQDWISLYCWAPFHATLMATPEGSRCHWEQISSTYSELSGCTQLLAQLLSCPWPGAVLDAFFLQVHAEYFTNCTGAGPPGLGGLPPAMVVAAAVGLGCLVPLAAVLTLSRARKGAQTPAGSCPAPACPRAYEGPATALFPPGPGN
ncbi:uncharacterized protein J5F26_014707 isoform 1-T1 [Ciconia maguari]